MGNLKLENLLLIERKIFNFARKHHHLPGIKNASQYESIGTVNLGELNTKLLEKVEELTLHTISQQRAIDNLIERLEKIESVSTTHNQPNKSQATNGLLIATFATFAFVMGKRRFSKLFNK